MTTPNQTVFEEMSRLYKDISYHADLYFNKDTQEIQNHVYDEMVQRFEVLSEHHPELAELLAANTKPVPIHDVVNEGLIAVTFKESMLSLRKALSHDQVDAFLEKVGKETDVVFEAKLDGLALRVTYLKGILNRISTRGSGLVGEDVTHALPLFDNIPEQLTFPGEVPDEFNVDGEAFILLDRFHQYNQNATKQASNPRNAVSGWVRSLPDNQNKAVTGQLSFAAYRTNEHLGATTYLESRRVRKELGFDLPPLLSMTEVKGNILSTTVPMDGVVIKVNLISEQEKLGETHQHPNWAIAYKFPNVEEETSLIEVEWNVAGSGRVIPVGIYEPVIIGGVSCSRTLLDNYRRFMALELRPGDIIGVTRNGDVIPRLNRIIQRSRQPPFKAPDTCPACDSVLEKRLTRIAGDLFCTNTTGCPDQLVGRCVRLVGKKVLDIQDLGPITLSELADGNWIQYPYDVLKLTTGAVGKKIFDNIQKVLGTTHPRWMLINALGLPGVDVVRAKKLANAWPIDMPLVDYLSNRELLEAIPGISVGVSLPIIMALKDHDFITNLVGLEGLIKVNDNKPINYELKVALTGSLGHTRDVLIEYFSERGVELTDKFTKDCSLLIVGDKPSEGKLLKATGWNIPILPVTKTSSLDALLINVLKNGVTK